MTGKRRVYMAEALKTLQRAVELNLGSPFPHYWIARFHKLRREPGDKELEARAWHIIWIWADRLRSDGRKLASGSANLSRWPRQERTGNNSLSGVLS